MYFCDMKKDKKQKKKEKNFRTKSFEDIEYRLCALSIQLANNVVQIYPIVLISLRKGQSSIANKCMYVRIYCF